MQRKRHSAEEIVNKLSHNRGRDRVSVGDEAGSRLILGDMAERAIGRICDRLKAAPTGNESSKVKYQFAATIAGFLSCEGR